MPLWRSQMTRLRSGPWSTGGPHPLAATADAARSPSMPTARATSPGGAPERSATTRQALLGNRRGDRRDRVAGGDRRALADRQLGDDARLVGGDLVLHLHRLDDAEQLALLDRVALSDL